MRTRFVGKDGGGVAGRVVVASVAVLFCLEEPGVLGLPLVKFNGRGRRG